MALFTVASLAGGFADDAATMLAARTGQGVGAALASPSALALLMTMFPEGPRRVRAIALYTVMSIAGGALGLVAGGMLTQWASWRWVMFVNVPIGLAAILAGRFVPPSPGRPGRFDLAGALSSTLGMTALVYAFVRVASTGWSDDAAILSFLAGAALLAAFVVVELRAPAPITPLRLFADVRRVSSYLARICQFAGMMGMFFFLTQFLRGVLGYSDLVTGFAFLPLTVVVFLASQLSARVLVDRVGAHRIMVVGITFSTLGMLWLTQLGEHSNYFELVGPLMVFGLGNGLAFVPLTTTSLDGVAPADAGAASGLVNVMQQLGGSLGLAVLVTVFGAASRSAAADVDPGLSPAQAARHVFVSAADTSFWTATAFLVATWLLVAFAIRPTKPEPVVVPDTAAELDAASV
jgi:EmrB/QacA subfamily drug resistance transporter